MNNTRIGSQTLASGIGSILSNQRIKTKHMEQYLLRWINDAQLVEAGDPQLRCYQREGQLPAFQIYDDLMSY